MAEQPPEDERRGKNIIGALVAVVVLALLIWLVHALHKNLELQKCELEGRRDCVDLPQPEN